MRTTKDLLDPAVDVCISYLCGRHACSLLHSGGIVIGTVYDDRIVMSSDERWPLPRGDPGLMAITQLLIARTQGNPFFLEESVRTLVETGALVGDRGAYHLAQ